MYSHTLFECDMPRDFSTESQRRRLRWCSSIMSTSQVSISEEIPASVCSSSVFPGLRLVNTP